MKKCLTALIFILVVFCCTSVAMAKTYGDYEYEVKNGTVTITGYNGKSTATSIPAEIEGLPVTTIGEKAFSKAEHTLERVNIPDSIVSIQDCAFDQCSRIKEMKIPDSVMEVLGNPFRYCFNIQFNISSDHPALAVMEGVLFSKADRRLVCYPQWKGLTEYSIPQGIEIISKNAFYDNNDLTMVYIPDSVTEIQDSAFSGCHSLGDMVFPEGLTKIGASAFWFCGMKNLTIPGSVTVIGKNAFSSMESLSTVEIGEGEEPVLIDEYAFSMSNLRKIEIHKDVSVSKGAFSSCKQMTEVVFDGEVRRIGKEAFNYCTSLMKIEIPGNVKKLEEMAFFNCSSLQEVILPDTMEKLHYGVFSDCNQLKKINLPRSITYISDSNLFMDCPDVTVTVGKSTLGETHCKENNIKIEYEEDTAPAPDWLNPAPTACPKCGYEIPEGFTFKFCPECGNQL